MATVAAASRPADLNRLDSPDMRHLLSWTLW
jgi:hypothetical protein